MSKTCDSNNKPKLKSTIVELPRARDGSKRITLYYTNYQGPFGMLYVVVTKQGAVYRLGFQPEVCNVDEKLFTIELNKYPCGEVCYQLDQYFSGSRNYFDVALALDQGTEFEQDVWKRLLKIEYGQTMSYGEVAQKVGRKLAARAVGNAVAKNPIPIIVPCHRVLPASGGLGNYSIRSMAPDSGQAIKKWLLNHEKAHFLRG